MKQIPNHKRQQGLAVVIALLILIALSLIVLSGSRNSTMQLRMASNLQMRMEAVQNAQAGLDYAESIDPTTITTGMNYLCYGDMGSFYVGSVTQYIGSCGTSLTLPSPIDTDTGLILVRDNTLEGDLPPSMETSVGLIESSYFRAYSGHDKSAAGQGRAVLGTGIMKFKLTDTAFQ
jgi:hypothetical protein